MDLSVMSSWFVDSFRKMFYLVTPTELALEAEDAIPDIFLRSGVPMFFIFIAIEVFTAYFVLGNTKQDKDGQIQQKHAFRYNEIVVSSILGSFQQIGLLLFEMAGLLFEVNAYIYVYDNYRLTDIHPKDHPWLCFIGIMLGRDLGYYLYHRFLHEYHVGWAGHNVHHSGEDYNLATGLRQGVFQPLCSPPFYCWMALLGVPPPAYAGHAQLNTLYMYWIHTDLVDRLPFGLEYILNTPMAHRMHHRTTTCNSNYAGLFIIWDRLFGTYRAEVTKQDNYGLASQPQSFDPFVLNTQHILRVWNNVGGKFWWELPFSRRNTTRWTINPSGLFTPIPPRKELEREQIYRVKWNGCKPMSVDVQVWVGAISVMLIVALVGLLMKAKSMSVTNALFCGLSGLAALSAVARICDQYQGQWKMAVVQSYVGTLLMFYFLMTAA